MYVLVRVRLRSNHEFSRDLPMPKQTTSSSVFTDKSPGGGRGGGGAKYTGGAAGGATNEYAAPERCRWPARYRPSTLFFFSTRSDPPIQPEPWGGLGVGFRARNPCDIYNQVTEPELPLYNLDVSNDEDPFDGGDMHRLGWSFLNTRQFCHFSRN